MTFRIGNIPWNKGKEGIQEAWNKGKNLSKEHRKKLSESHLGNKPSIETRKKMSESATGEKSSQWKGDNVGYSALHTWVSKRKEKPKLCEICRKKRPIDLANKGVYDRNIENWEWLCRKCHMLSDGRLEKLFSEETRNKAKESFRNYWAQRPKRTEWSLKNRENRNKYMREWRLKAKHLRG